VVDAGNAAYAGAGIGCHVTIIELALKKSHGNSLKSLLLSIARSARPGNVLAAIFAGSVVFFVSLLISARYYYAGRTFSLKTAVISHLQAPAMNPHGYLIASVGTAICGVLLFPAVVFLYERASVFHRRLSIAGALMFGLGLLETVVIGCLSPFPAVYEKIHIPLAFATFIAMVVGIFIFLSIALHPAWRSRKALGGALILALIFMAAVLAFLLFLYFHQAFFDENSWIRNRAVYEWILSVLLSLYTSMLVVVLAKMTIQPSVPDTTASRK
jgi:Protein of unknown function (DUF998)